MRKYILLTLCMLLVLMSGLTLYAAEQRVVKVGVFNFYPAIFKDTDGTVKGFYVDAMADIALRENIRFEYVSGSWGEGLERIKTGEVDLLTSVAHTRERAEFLDYAKTPLLTVWGELYVPLSSDIDGILAVQGKKIAVMKNDFNARYFSELVKKFDITCEFVEVPGFEDVFEAVATKKVDAGVVNNTFGVAKHKEFGLRPSGVVFNPFDIYFAVAKDKNSDLMIMLDNYLISWRNQPNSVYSEARHRWLHTRDTIIKVTPRWLLSTFAVISFLSLFAFAFIVILKKQVRNKTRSIVEAADQYRSLAHKHKLSEERLRLIMESVAVIPWEFNIPENRWAYVGPQVTELMGYAPEEWANLEWWLEIIHPEDRVWVPPYCADQTARGEEHSMEYRLRKKDGSFIWVNDLVTIEMMDGKPLIMRGVLIDINKRKQAEETIEAARKQLAAKNKELEQLVYVASHDLRSPLVNVDGFSRELEYSVNELSVLLEGGDYAALEKALRAEFPDMVKSIGRIRASTRQMDNLLKALLKLARAGRAALRIETLNMDELLGQLVPSFAYQLRETGMTMTVDQLPPCQGDAVQVTQAFSNLIDNAIKYHQKDRPGVITIRGTAEGGRALYRVEDNGMGIAESNREKIFELFHRLNPKEAEGEGLGLTMVRQILGGMNGEITVESKPGEGSAFIVSLPGVKKNRQ